jgi:hypothetical protein
MSGRNDLADCSSITVPAAGKNRVKPCADPGRRIPAFAEAACYGVFRSGRMLAQREENG